MPPSPGIDERSSRFFNDVIVFIQTIGSAPGTLRTIEQLVSAAGSMPANRAEAREASSRMEFVRFKLALRGARESLVWLTGCESGRWGDAPRRKQLMDEADQIVRILTAIVVKSTRNN